MSEKKIRPFNLNSGRECNRWNCPSFDRDSEQNCCYSETSKVCLHSKEYKSKVAKVREKIREKFHNIYTGCYKLKKSKYGK